MLYKKACVVEIVNSAVFKTHLISAMRDICMICYGIFKQPLVHIRFNLVISVYEADPLSGSFPHSMQTGRCNTSVLLKDRLYP